jgi:hypothetical protein
VPRTCGKLYRKNRFLNQSLPKIASYIKRYLETEVKGVFSVHSIFQNVINFSDGSLLFSVSNSCVPITPTSVVLSESNLFKNFSTQSNFGEFLSVNYPVLKMQGLQISVAGANVIETDIEYYPLPRRCHILGFFSEVIDATKDKKGIIELLHKKNNQDVFLNRINNLIKSMRKSFLCNDQENFGLSVKNLSGLGIGLTPSGDDFIYGLYATFLTFNIKPEFTKKIDNLIDEYRHNMSDISANFLKTLRQRHIYMPLKELFRDLNAIKNGKERITDLVSYGSTSGCDILAGVVFALKSLY